MRLTPFEVIAIKQTALEVFGSTAEGRLDPPYSKPNHDK
jgi:hypothetical protein